jgi:hypothetical protein
LTAALSPPKLLQLQLQPLHQLLKLLLHLLLKLHLLLLQPLTHLLSCNFFDASTVR